MAFGALRGMFGMGGGRSRTPGGPQGAFGQQVFKQKPPMNQPPMMGAGGMGGPGPMKPPNQPGQMGGFGQALGGAMQQGGMQKPPMFGQGGRGPQPQELRGGYGRPPVGFAPDPNYGQKLRDWQNKPLTGYSDPNKPGGMMPGGYKPPMGQQGGGGNVNRPSMPQGNPWGNWPGGRSPYEGGISHQQPMIQNNPNPPQTSDPYTAWMNGPRNTDPMTGRPLEQGPLQQAPPQMQDQRMRIPEEQMGQGGIGPSPNMNLPPELQQQRDQIDQIRNQFQSRGQVPY